LGKVKAIRNKSDKFKDVTFTISGSSLRGVKEVPEGEDMALGKSS